jgi:glycosyltransferase 2 family protein
MPKLLATPRRGASAFLNRLPRSAKTWAKFTLTFGITLFFAYIFVRDLDFAEVADALLAANYVYVPFALALFALSLFVRAMRWQAFYSPDPPSLRLLFPTILITFAGNNLLPARAGELVRAQVLSDRAGLSRTRTVGTAVLERLFDFAILGSFVVIGMFLADIGIAFLGAGLGLAGAALVSLTVAFVIVNRPQWVSSFSSRRWPLVSEKWRDRLAYYAELFLTGFSVLRSARLTRNVFILTLTAWLLEFSMYWLIAVAFSIEENFLAIAFAGAAANLALTIPSAQGGVGPFQFVTKEALLRFGVAQNAAAAYALALHVLLVAPVSLIGIIVFWSMLPARGSLIKAGIEAESSDSRV